MIQNKLVIFFDNFPMGSARGEDIQERVQHAFNKTLCQLKLKNGHLNPTIGGKCPIARIPLIHGFFHITDMDFYRTDEVTHWAETLIGDCFLCRKYDDQIAVTVPAAMIAPERAWGMRENGIRLDVFHNGAWDGKERAGGFKKYWRKGGSEHFPAAKCPITNGG
jgi:hypothetical protein